MISFTRVFYKIALIILISFSFLELTHAQYYVEYNDAAREIYKDIIDLKLKRVPEKIIAFKRDYPNNLVDIHLDNYLDFFTLFVNEEEELFKKLKKNKSKRIKEIEKKLTDDNAYKQFLIAEINLQWALTRSKFGELFKASREIYAAYNLLSHNDTAFPDFVLNKKSLSILHSLVETITIPGFFKSILGLEGSIDLAKIEIEQVIADKSPDNIFKEESDAIKAYILFYQANERDKAWEFVQASSLNESESLLATFLKIKFAQRIGENTKAIEFFENRPKGKDFSNFDYLDYQYGLSLLRALDPRAKTSLEKFVNNFNGRHFIKEAYQKLAWSELVFQNDTSKYFEYLSDVEIHGDDLVDDDKQALYESKKNEVPNIALLKARLLFDGGYYSKSIEILNEEKEILNVGTPEFVECEYRLGRAYQMIDDYDKAKYFFLKVIDSHVKDKSYYDCNAALQLGLMEEGRTNYTMAIEYYQTCLSINPTSYKQSLHQKAKSGLLRLN